MTVDREARTLARLRSLLFAVLGLAFLGTGAELLLIGHTEEFWQLVPLIAVAAGLALLVPAWWKPSRRGIQLFRVVMGLFIGAGALGLILHYRGNAAFELEMQPEMAGMELVWKALTGATPALAPGSMIPVGLLGLAATIGHPALSRNQAARSDR